MTTETVLAAQAVFKGYAHPSGTVTILQGLQLDIQRGESVSIIGPSGAGKSTLLTLLAGLDFADKGTVKLMGRDLATLSSKSLAAYRGRHLGIVFQQFHLLGQLTALENVALPLEIRGPSAAGESQALATQALVDVGLGHRLRHFPREMSGGECQRVAIARAMVVRPDVLLADEPSGNLDAETGVKVMDMLFTLAAKQGTTLILVTHNDELAKRCSRRLRLEQGRLRELS